MTFLAPMIGQITGRIVYYPDAQAGKLKGLPGGLARFAGMYGFYYFGPVNGLKINI
jgi:hypothetical protein